MSTLILAESLITISVCTWAVVALSSVRFENCGVLFDAILNYSFRATPMIGTTLG
jgi:hypothetical protein